ncbi:MAG: di-trans,poly-cis-decaprenylcistransferase [Gaiellales bacterium]|nr:MAG: di-trans,poly-cis-decaprenylcistransferase [Gaiellales bacterium]
MDLRNFLANLRRGRTEREDFLLTADAPGPRYVAIIMDGNGRWAARRRLPTIAGHREGAKALKRTISAASQAGVRELSVYAFSTENWQRPREEVDALMEMFVELIEREVPELDQQDIRMRFIGRHGDLSQELRDKIDWAEGLTAGNGGMTLYVAFNYGGRAEIVDAVGKMLGEGVREATEDRFRQYLYAPEMHDPELLIRTSGELRVSNFLLWQSAYAELVFLDKLWPNFKEEDLYMAMAEFNKRQRRFGAREV